MRALYPQRLEELVRDMRFVSRSWQYMHVRYRHTDVNGVVHVWVGSGTPCGAPSRLFAHFGWADDEYLAPTCLYCVTGMVDSWSKGPW